MNKCVAHRGWSGRAPENTMAAFRLALEEPEIHAIELDVHLSKDGVPVVIHDHALERTTNGLGPVIGHTEKELRELDAGAWFGPQSAGERIPFLEEVLALTKGKKHLLIELKQMSGLYYGLEEAVAGLIHKYEMHNQVTVISFDHKSVKKIKEVNQNIETGLIFLGRPTMLAEQLIYTGASHLSMYHGFITEGLVKFFKDYKVQVGAWTIDDKASIDRIRRISENILITTNHPELMIGKAADLNQSPAM